MAAIARLASMPTRTGSATTDLHKASPVRLGVAVVLPIAAIAGRPAPLIVVVLGDAKAGLAVDLIVVATIEDVATIFVDRFALDPEERAWIDAYHGRVRDALAPSLDAATRAWLDQATAPLAD